MDFSKKNWISAIKLVNIQPQCCESDLLWHNLEGAGGVGRLALTFKLFKRRESLSLLFCLSLRQALCLSFPSSLSLPPPL
jgi:hypothetical protein